MKTHMKIRLYLYVLMFGMFFISCSDEMENITPVSTSKVAPAAAGASVKNVVEVIPFSAVAMIADCYGENIRFGGMLEQRVVTTVDGRGKTHITRHFRPTELTAQGTVSGTMFDIVGGAEMFSIHYDADGKPTPAGSRIFIHQGTLVFVSQVDGSKVVARHTIRKVPGRDDIVSFWDCAGK